MNRTTAVALFSLTSIFGAGCPAAPAMGVQPAAGSGGTTGGSSGSASGSGGTSASGGTSGGGGVPSDPGAADVQIQIRSDADVHPISPLIYGTSQPDSPAQNR